MLATGLIADSYTAPTFGFRRSLGTQVAIASGSTLVITTTGDIAIGDLVVVRVAADNLSATTPTFTCADSGGNTYTVQKHQAINATAALGVAGAIICSKATSAVAAGGTITVTLSGAVVARAVYAESFFGFNNTVRSTAVSASAASTAATVTSGTVNSGDLVLGCICSESRTAFSGDTDTLNGAWSTLVLLPAAAGGTDAARVEVAGQYKIPTASGAQTYNATVPNAEWAALIVVLQKA